MNRFYSVLLLVASFLENLATSGAYIRAGSSGVWYGPSAFIIVFFVCAVLCICRRLVDVVFGGKPE